MRSKGSYPNIKDLLDMKHHSEGKSCNPQRHIFYLKVAKTGSSTLANILTRNALSYNTRLCKLHDSSTFHSKLQDNKKAEEKFKCELHSSPSRHYSSDRVHQYMRNDTISIGIMRYPFNNFRSKYYFFQKQSKKYSKFDLKGDAIATILNNSKYDPKLRHFGLKGTHTNLQNSMYKYFQLDDVRAMTDEKYFQDSIKTVEKEISLIFINEYYDESLILFKRMACWEMKDILYIIHKEASYVNKVKTPEDYGPLFDRHKNISSIDYNFYDHFVNVHKLLVKNAGPSFAKEVSAFKMVNIETSKFCWDIYNKLTKEIDFVTAKALAKKELVVKEGRFNPRFKVTGGDCILMTLSVQIMSQAIRAVNYPENCDRKMSRPRVERNFCNANQKKFVYKNIPFSVVQSMLMTDVMV